MTQLVGRLHEREVLGRALREAACGRPGAIVVRGPAGSGRSALLQWTSTSTSARDFEVVSVMASSADADLPYGVLAHLLAGMGDALPDVPAPQSEALLVAVGRRAAAGRDPDRLLVGLAVLAFLERRARDRPLLWIVDDSHHLDAMSAETLAFVARRLSHQRVLLLFAADSETSPGLDGLQELNLDALDPGEARSLLGVVVPGLVDETVMSRIVIECGGLPGTIVAAYDGLTAVDLAGGLETPTRVSGRVDDRLRRRYLALSTPARRLLVLAALDPTGDPDLLGRAAARVGIRKREFHVVDDAGLIDVGARVSFVDPFVRAFVLSSVTSEEIRRAHGALSRATQGRVDPERRVWHRARATARPSERLARSLVRLAPRVAVGGGVAAEAAFLAAAASATPDVDTRARRSLDAAETTWRAGGSGPAQQLLRTAERGRLDERDRARARRLRAVADLTHDGDAALARELLAAARELVDLDPPSARGLYLDALEVVALSARPGMVSPRAIATEGYGVARTAGLDPVGAALLEWYSLAPVQRRATDVERLTRAVAEHAELSDWAWLGVQALVEVGEEDAAVTLAERAVRQRRGSGEVGKLPLLLNARAVLAVDAGELERAAGLVADAAAVATALGTPSVDHGAVMLAAWRGDSDALAALVGTAATAGSGRDGPRSAFLVDLARAVVANCRLEARTPPAPWAGEGSEPIGFGTRGLGEWTEATVRSGDPAQRDAALALLGERTEINRTDLSLGVLARCGALARADGSAADQFESAIEHLARTRNLLELGRARLYFGEWLETGGRGRGEQQLTTALEIFSAAGASLLARRAASGLGEATVMSASSVVAGPAPPELTEQEARIAGMVAAGRSNPEIAAELHISRRTVEYHLHKVFVKMGVSSRHTLAARLRDEPGATG